MKSRPRPKFFSGYIEGYYGRLLTFEERLGIVRKLRDIGATHYLYAPKEDLFNRKEWRHPYPAAWMTEFRKFVAASKRLGISVIPGLAPGLSYRYENEADFRSLLKKMLAFASAGCGEFCLLMDDIPEQLPKGAKGIFASLGEAHVLLLERLRMNLNSLGLKRLWFCPTVYSDFFAPKGLKENPYLKDLSRNFPADVEWMWTGQAIVSEKITSESLSIVTKMMDRGPIIWDNLYANDYCPGRIFLGPFSGRPSELRKSVSGLMLNPTGLYQTDLFHLDLLGGFLRGDSAQEVWREALKKSGVPEGFVDVADFLSSPFILPGEKINKKLHRVRLVKILINGHRTQGKNRRTAYPLVRKNDRAGPFI